MRVTVTMIEEKDFKTKVRGYDPEEVDEFLDDICDTMIDMQKTINSLDEKLKQKDSPGFMAPPSTPAARTPLPLSPAPIFEPTPTIPADLESAKKLLDETQRICDETIAEAKKRAEAIVKEAEESVPDPDLIELEAQKQAARDELSALQEKAENYRKRFQSLLKDQNEILEAELF